jgi:hypothetical protein
MRYENLGQQRGTEKSKIPLTLWFISKIKILINFSPQKAKVAIYHYRSAMKTLSTWKPRPLFPLL